MADEDYSADYQVLEELGRGSFGVVYKGIEKATGETVAIKQINLEASDDDIAEIKQEISVLSACDNSIITKYKRSFLRGHKLWIVMEYIGGGSCLDLLKPGNFYESHIAIICRELLRGLEYLQSECKIHRDIKAANVLLTETGQVKLADFGVAAQLTTTLSIRNTFVGTPFWMSPETICQAGHDFRADIWSLGITAIEMATGEPPLADVPPTKALFLIPKNSPPRLEGNFSKEFKDFVAECLTYDADHRPFAKDLLKHKFIRSAGKVEALQELIERKQNWDASMTRVKHPVFYQETLRTMSAKDDDDGWVFGTVKTVAPMRRTMARPRRSYATAKTNGDSMRKLDVKDGPLQPSTPGSTRKTTVKRDPSWQYPNSVRRISNESPRNSVVQKQAALQPDLSFGNSGSSVRLFRRVPSDASGSSMSSSSRDSVSVTNENRPISTGPFSLDDPAKINSKESLLGCRLYSKALEPTLVELHAQTAVPAKREALGQLADAFVLLNSIDPEGTYHFVRSLVSSVAQDSKLSTAVLSPVSVVAAARDISVDHPTPHGTVLIKNQQLAPSGSPTKLVFSQANPHLKSHRRKQSAINGPLLDSPETRDERSLEKLQRDRERIEFEAKFPGREPPPGMEHCKQLSDALYAQWSNGLRQRWASVVGA